jgi:hypothetical protein
VDGTNDSITASSVTGLRIGGGPWSFECWIYRTDASGADTLLLTFDTPSEDGPQIDLETDGDVTVSRRGGGGSTSTTSQPITLNTWHHLVVTFAGSGAGSGAVTVYVNGASQAGTGSLSGFGDDFVNFTIARAGSGFVGNIQHVAWYDAALSAATALAHYEQGITLVPEDMEVQYDSSEDAHFAYVVSEVKGGSGWVRPDNASSWPLGSAHIYVEGRKVKTDAQRNRRGKAALRRARKVIGGSFTVTGWHGWRAGQLLTIDESALGLSSTHQIQSVNGELAAGNAATYRIEFGAPRKSLVRKVKRRKRPRDD